MFKREENAFVLDFLPSGKPGEAKKEAIAQVMGEYYFTLLEVVVKKDVSLSVGELVYVGKGVRDKVDYIKSRIFYNQLTNSAQRELSVLLREKIKLREKEFVSFINRAGAINIRVHSLELLPSIGKKHLQSILEERSKKPFESFEDIQKRVPHLGSIEDVFVNRIIEELHGESKYYLFTIPPKKGVET